MSNRFVCARCGLELRRDDSGWSTEYPAIDEEADTPCTVHLPMREDT